MFYGLKSSPAPMGDPTEMRDFKTPPGAPEGASDVNVLDPGSHFDASNELAGNEFGLFVDLGEIFDGTGAGADGFELRLPHFDVSNLSLPSLFTLLSDPSVIIKGLNVVLKELQGVLKGEFSLGLDKASNPGNAGNRLDLLAFGGDSVSSELGDLLNFV